jgi:hypothetical protein
MAVPRFARPADGGGRPPHRHAFLFLVSPFSLLLFVRRAEPSTLRELAIARQSGTFGRFGPPSYSARAMIIQELTEI